MEGGDGDDDGDAEPGAQKKHKAQVRPIRFLQCTSLCCCCCRYPRTHPHVRTHPLIHCLAACRRQRTRRRPTTTH